MWLWPGHLLSIPNPCLWNNWTHIFYLIGTSRTERRWDKGNVPIISETNSDISKRNHKCLNTRGEFADICPLGVRHPNCGLSNATVSLCCPFFCLFPTVQFRTWPSTEAHFFLLEMAVRRLSLQFISNCEPPLSPSPLIHFLASLPGRFSSSFQHPNPAPPRPGPLGEWSQGKKNHLGSPSTLIDLLVLLAQLALLEISTESLSFTDPSGSLTLVPTLA